jgi:tetratricopeptide (TPR) repeat protein
MKKKLLFLIVLLAVVSAGGIGYYVWKARTQSPRALFESGKKYYDQKKYREAMIQFLNLLRKDPRHHDGRLLLARTLVASGDISHAIGQLKALLENSPNDVAANLELGSIYLFGGRSNPAYFQQAMESAKQVLAKEPNNVDALVLSGNASAGLKDYSGSVDTLEKAIDLDPNNSRALITLGTAQALQKNLPEAEKSFIKARDANPKDQGAALSLANYYSAIKDSAKAEAAFKDALALNPADRQTYLRAGDFYSRAGRYDEVEKVLQNAQSRSTDDPSPSLTLASFYETQNRRGDVRKLLLDLKTKFPKNFAVASALAVDLMQDQPDRARTEIDQMIKTDPRNPLGYLLLGESQFIAGQFAAAEETLGKDPALNSRFPQVHFFLGDLAVRKGQLDQAIDHFHKSLALNKTYLPARLALAETFLKKGKLAESREEVRNTLQIAPGNPSARLLKSTLDLAEKNYPEAERELLALEKEQPANRLVQRQLGAYYGSRGNTAEAEKSLTKALELAPNSEESFRDLIGLYVATKQTDRAIQKLNSVPDAQKQAFHYELIGVADAVSGKLQDAENAYKKALEKDPNQGSSARLLFDLYAQSKRYDDAKRMLDERLQKNPSNPGAVIAMRGTLYEVQGKTDEARKDYEKALESDPNQILAANNLAYILADQGRDLDTALKYAQSNRSRQPEDPNIADTLGWVYYKMRRSLLARDSVRFAASKDPDNPVIQYHLGVIYKANNQPADAEAALKKALASPRQFKERAEADAALKDIEHWRHLVK